jgi:hypothetical protein
MKHACLVVPLFLVACQPSTQSEKSDEETEIANGAISLDDVAPRLMPEMQLRLSKAAPFGAKPQDSTACVDINGYLDDPDPAGRNIRDIPSKNGALLGVIPPQGGLDFPPSFTIIESKNGWLRIKDAGFDTQLVGNVVPQTYSGEGWISGKGVRVNLQTQLGFAAPSHDSPWLVDGRPDQFFDSIEQAAVVGCSGKWVLVDWPFDPNPPDDRKPLIYREQAIVSRNPVILRAWSTGVCNNQETSCDGVNGDLPQN